MQRQESLNVRYIRSIQKLKSGKSVQKAFEIFTDSNRYNLKYFKQ